MGSTKAEGRERDIATPGWIVAPAVVVALAFMVWRHAVGQTPFPSGNGLNVLFDKWHLSPLRLLDFLALLVVILRWGNRLAPWFARPFLARLGAASLSVFCAHLVICLLALAILGSQYDHRGWGVDVALLIGTFAALLRGRRGGVTRCWFCRRPRERQTEGRQFTCGAIADLHSA